jgi:hypothetical protein
VDLFCFDAFHCMDERLWRLALPLSPNEEKIQQASLHLLRTYNAAVSGLVCSETEFRIQLDTSFFSLQMLKRKPYGVKVHVRFSCSKCG